MVAYHLSVLLLLMLHEKQLVLLLREVELLQLLVLLLQDRVLPLHLVLLLVAANLVILMRLLDFFLTLLLYCTGHLIFMIATYTFMLQSLLLSLFLGLRHHLFILAGAHLMLSLTGAFLCIRP